MYLSVSIYICDFMACLVYTTAEKISNDIGTRLKENPKLQSFDHLDKSNTNKIEILEINTSIIDSDYLSSKPYDAFVFVSRHVSSKGVLAFTVHPLGRISENNYDLGVADPIGMLKMLQSINKLCRFENVTITYEATHHGPILSKRSFFTEFGGPINIEGFSGYTSALSLAIAESFDIKVEYECIALGISGTHYPKKFTEFAINGKYAFSHILPEYNLTNINIIKSAIEHSNPKPDIAIIEKKGLNSMQRKMVIDELNKIGMESVMV